MIKFIKSAGIWRADAEKGEQNNQQFAVFG